MAPHSSTLAWKIPWTEEPGGLQSMGVTRSQTQLSDFTFTFHFHALEKEMATHSSVLAWRIPGTGETGGLPSLGLHRVGHDWSDLVVVVVFISQCYSQSIPPLPFPLCSQSPWYTLDWRLQLFYLETCSLERVRAQTQEEYKALKKEGYPCLLHHTFVMDFSPWSKTPYLPCCLVLHLPF